MSKRLIMICAIAFVLGLAVSAHAAVQNVKVSGDLKASAIGRDNFDLGLVSATLAGTGTSNVIMSQARVRVDTDLTENVAATIRLLNETDWGREDQDAGNTDIEIDLANMTLKEMFDSPISVTLGRQEIRLGNGFVVGDPDTNRTAMVNTGAGATPIANLDLSQRKAFDAVRASLDYNPLVVDLIYSKIDENVQSSSSQDKDDIDFYGLNAGYTLSDNWKTTVEGYYLYKKDATLNVGTLNTAKKTDTVHTPGVRVSTNPTKGLNLQGEIAWQFGTWTAPAAIDTAGGVSRNREAMAAQLISSYALPFAKLKEYSPVVGAVYSYYSGDKNAADDTAGAKDEYHAWDPMFEDQGSGITNVLFQATNVHVIDLNASLVPIEDLTLRVDYKDLWLAKEANDGRWAAGAKLFTLYGIDGTNTTPRLSERHLGREFDLALAYDYTEDVQLGLSAGMFLPGNAFSTLNGLEPKNATQVIGSCAVSF